MNKLIIGALIVVILALILFREPRIEGLNDEAISNIASVYNVSDMKITNLEATGTISGPTINNLNSKINSNESKINSNKSKGSSLESKIKSLESKQLLKIVRLVEQNMEVGSVDKVKIWNI